MHEMHEMVQIKPIENSSIKHSKRIEQQMWILSYEFNGFY